MPIYEYKCKACAHKFDKLQKINDPVFIDCPDCGKPELIKLISAAGFRLKGTGWYETDFKNSGRKSSDTTGKDGSNNKTDKKLDSKTTATSKSSSAS